MSFQFVIYKTSTYDFHQTIKYVKRKDITYFNIKMFFRLPDFGGKAQI